MGGVFLADFVNKKTAPYIIWTVVALVCAIFFWLSRSGEQSSSADSARSSASGRGSGKRRRPCVSLCLDGTLLDSSGVAVAEAVGPFLELCAAAELFVVGLATTDAREEEVKTALESVGAFNAGLQRHRVMFSSTLEGRGSMVRQLQPALHLETEQSVASALTGKISEVRLVGSPHWPTFGYASSLTATPAAA
mmetsp:Transcript_41072/g.108502  ORF Transcript_41072/g.108502 Transcript_41072/m.108502 type:complete len:193 (-) Transcript_41072:65-643(-)